MSAAEKRAVFLSYASQDAEAARRICETLRASGIEVWFDVEGGLEHGDEWDAKSRRQIKECVLFIPVISANTQARHEGYFRIEWDLAAERARGIASGVAFILPVVIDDTRDADALVPDRFRAVQWTRLRGGEVPPEVQQRFLKLWSHRTGVLKHSEMEPGRPRPGERDVGVASPTNPLKVGRRFPAAAWLGVAALCVAVALAVWQPWKKPAPGGLSEARKLVVQARALFEDGDWANRENFFTAEDLLKRALALDSTDGEVWAAQAELSADLISNGYDSTNARRESLRLQAERAMKLAPDSIEAQLAYASHLKFTDEAAANADAIRRLQQLAARAPNNRRVFRTLGVAWMTAENFDEMVKAYDRANALPGGDPEGLQTKAVHLMLAGRYQEAEDAVAQSLALRPVGRALLWDVVMKLCWRGDVNGAAAALERWPAWLRLEDRGVFLASQVWLWRHEPDKAIAALNAVSRDYINTWMFVGPRSGLLALAHEMAGNRPDVARGEWENAKRVAGANVGADWKGRRALAWKACAMQRLGETKEAEAIYRDLAQSGDLLSEFWSCGASSALLRIAFGHGDEVAAKLLSDRRVEGLSYLPPVPQAALKLNPVFEPIRATPEFQRLIAAAPAPNPSSSPSPKAATAAPVISEKSLAVLLLENLSPDPENAFFTDGLHVEIIDTLSRIADLTVISRNSALAFKGSTAPLAEIAQKLGVANVITGSVRRAGDTVRIQLELRRARDEALLWSSPKGDRELKDALDLQSEVADQVARVLQARESRGSYGGAQFMTRDPKAFDLFLKVKNEYYSGRFAGPAQTAAMIKTLEEVVQLDPNFVSAAMLLSIAHVRAYHEKRTAEERTREAAESKRWAETASRLAPGGAGDGALVTYYNDIPRDFPRALALAENAARALPNDAMAQHRVAGALTSMGRLAEALVPGRRALELDPLALIVWRSQMRRLQALRRSTEFSEQAAKYLAAPAASRTFPGLATLQFNLTGQLPANLDEVGTPERLALLWSTRRWPELLTLIEGALQPLAADDQHRVTLWLQKHVVLRLLGRTAEAEEVRRAVVPLAEAGVAALAALPNELLRAEAEMRLASAYAIAGRAADAVVAGRRAVEIAMIKAVTDLSQAKM